MRDRKRKIYERQSNVKKKINEIVNVLRKKYLALKLGRDYESETINRVIRPITDSLKQISENTKLVNNVKTKQTIKSEIKKGDEHSHTKIPLFKAKKLVYDDIDENELTTPIMKKSSPPRSKVLHEEDTFLYTPQDEEVIDNKQNDSLTEIQRSVSKMTPEVVNQFLEQYHELPRTYIVGLLNSEFESDQITGVQYDPNTEKWTIGDSDVELDGKDLIIKGIRYEGTPGLYELLFKKEPIGFKKTDAAQYNDILNKTNARHRNYDPNEQIRGTRSKKYKNVIKPLVMSSNKKKGGAIGKLRNKQIQKSKLTKRIVPNLTMEVNDSKIQYIYYDTANELIDRLRYLKASELAGNNSHRNEISSIIEELRELGVIQ
jgi:hypothetical protein